MVSKMLSPRTGEEPVDTRIANRAIVTIEIISRAAIIIVMGMIFAVIGVSICGMLGTTR
jgi:hypothetical protein